MQKNATKRARMLKNLAREMKTVHDKVAKSQGRNPQPQRDRLAGLRTRVKLADCTVGFAVANRNPFAAFENNIPPVCMPDSIVLPTYKARVITKGTGAAGTTGVGFALLAPNIVTDDGICVITSGSATVCSTTSNPNAVTGKISHFYGGSRFSNSDLGEGQLERRTCAAGLRVRYTGTVLNAGGTVYAYRSPSNSSLLTTDLIDWINLPETKRFPLTREWTNVRWKISNPEEQDFVFSTGPIYSMAIAVVSATGTTQPFEVEAVNFHELVGRSSGAKTMSHSDPVGFGAVQAVATLGADANKGTGEHPKSIVSQLEGYIAKGTSFVAGAGNLVKGGSSLYSTASEFSGLFSGDAAAMASLGEEAGMMALMAL